MLPLVNKLAQPRHWKVFGNIGRHCRRRDEWERHGAEIFFEMPEERIPQALAIQDPTRNERARHRSVSGASQQQAHLGDAPHTVNTHRHRLDIDDWEAPANMFEFVVAQPSWIRVWGANAHSPIVPEHELANTEKVRLRAN